RRSPRQQGSLPGSWRMPNAVRCPPIRFSRGSNDRSNLHMGARGCEMSNPEEQQADSVDRAVDTQDGQGAEPLRERGPADSVALQTTQPAGATTPQPAVLSSDDPFALLGAVLAQLEGSGSSTTAAGVGARMKQIDNAFNVRDLGFPSFKTFLEE